MGNSFKLPQLLLRIALGIGFLVTVSDRLGILGPFGTRNVEWGGWDKFIDYMGGIATFFEALIGILLIIGFKTKQAAIGSCTLTLIFALSMTVFLGIKAPVNFAVFPVCTASLLLSAIPFYDWSIDSSFIKAGRRI